MVDIFEMWYFIIAKLLFFKVLMCECRLLLTTIFIENTFFILFTLKILFEKVSCNVCFMLELYLPKQFVLFWNYGKNFSVECHLLRVFCANLFFLFPFCWKFWHNIYLLLRLYLLYEYHIVNNYITWNVSKETQDVKYVHRN